jgi:ribosomal protein L16 Arg81 hydroxylase
MKWMTGFRRYMVLLTLAMISFPALAHYIGMAPSYGEDVFHAAMMNSMVRMDRDMKSAPIIGDPDHDFAAMMIPHHQGAVDMAKAELLYGKDPVLRRLAQEIIVTQNSEIQVMQQQLAKYEPGRESEMGKHSTHSEDYGK